MQVTRARAQQYRDRFPLAVFIFVTIHAGLTATTGLLVIDWSSLLGVVYFIGFELLFVGIAYDLTEALLAFLLSPQDLPRQTPLDGFPAVALLITVCDDVVPEILERLRDQIYPNYAVFVLDDSSDEGQRALVDHYGYNVLRRGTRRGYKAGNLNYWLNEHGADFKYFVVLDSDSRIPSDFVTRMVEYAEHPDNERVAVFQSKILAWKATTLFSRVVGALAPVRLHILDRVANQMRMMLSWGHNNLNRTACVLGIGGFPEQVTAEDTALTLTLSACGYSVRLVDVVSYDTEPADAIHYAHRTVRWAKQTVELFRWPWRTAAFRLKLLLCYHVYNYLSYSLYLGLLLLTAWTFKAEGGSWRDFVTLVSDNQNRLELWFVALLAMTGLWTVQVTFRVALTRRAGVCIRDFLLHTMLSTPLCYLVAAPVAVGMLRTALGADTVFTPTNQRISASPTLGTIVNRMLPSMACGVLIMLGVVVRNRYLIFSLNCLWLVFLLTAPLLLWAFHTRDQHLK